MDDPTLITPYPVFDLPPVFDGLNLHASVYALPAATTTMFFLAASLTALSIAVLLPPPSDKDKITGNVFCLDTHCTPSITATVSPLPVLSNTFTEYTLAPLATP